MQPLKVYTNTDSVLRIDGVQNQLNKQYINDATVTVTLMDEDGVELTGISQPLTMSYIADSDGSYQTTVSDSHEAEVGTTGTAVISVVSGSLNLELTYGVEYAELTANEMQWSSKRDLDNMFGTTNINTWADLENQGSAQVIADRIAWAVEAATEDAKIVLRNSPSNVDALTYVPTPLRVAVTRKAGVMLYESRGVLDVDAEGQSYHRLSRHEKLADKFFQQVTAGRMVLGSAPSEMVPVVFSADDTDDDVIVHPWEA